MSHSLEILSGMEYPGRVIIIGADTAGEHAVVVYAITGRSSSSQARKISVEENRILVVPTDEAAVREGNLDLLVYPAISVSRGIVVSNGKQTGDIVASLHGHVSAVDVLRSSLSSWEFEPDAPTYTPRISGCVLPSGKAALSIIRREKDGSSRREYFDFSLKAGHGKIIATYSGHNRDPLPSFSGAPVDIGLEGKSHGEEAERIYAALAGRDRTKDFRVAVVCFYGSDLENDIYSLSIINRHERKENP